eukprot:m.302456 g.302456  ORF g.302456 m.302456 type:complete len:358 (-) comp15202_c0_seq1:55-1128(-)
MAASAALVEALQLLHSCDPEAPAQLHALWLKAVADARSRSPVVFATAVAGSAGTPGPVSQGQLPAARGMQSQPGSAPRGPRRPAASPAVRRSTVQTASAAPRPGLPAKTAPAVPVTSAPPLTQTGPVQGRPQTLQPKPPARDVNSSQQDQSQDFAAAAAAEEVQPQRRSTRSSRNHTKMTSSSSTEARSKRKRKSSVEIGASSSSSEEDDSTSSSECSGCSQPIDTGEDVLQCQGCSRVCHPHCLDGDLDDDAATFDCGECGGRQNDSDASDGSRDSDDGAGGGSSDNDSNDGGGNSNDSDSDDNDDDNSSGPGTKRQRRGEAGATAPRTTRRRRAASSASTNSSKLKRLRRLSKGR